MPREKRNVLANTPASSQFHVSQHRLEVVVDDRQKPTQLFEQSSRTCPFDRIHQLISVFFFFCDLRRSTAIFALSLGILCMARGFSQPQCFVWIHGTRQHRLGSGGSGGSGGCGGCGSDTVLQRRACPGHCTLAPNYGGRVPVDTTAGPAPVCRTLKKHPNGSSAVQLRTLHSNLD